ncbi:hypothetical protein [Acetomicrobium sp. UBA5826]|uniref:hypothetical protein n=1 Tax=Acetomicrobium sp. UBA5826 TaxID=1946039 RepID=UPI00257FBDAE|nr:hypothetical protein [Acetomicrobium sp. UBA5826]
MAKGHKYCINNLLRLDDLKVIEEVKEADEDVIVIIKFSQERRRRASVLTAAQSVFTDTAMQDQGRCCMLTFAVRGYT